ncbi:MAG TPA: FtsX-like permease family protein [Rhizomicrobium sp.]|nr:FtsX-like permease family protein [Rhizomicrobium sp.]
MLKQIAAVSLLNFKSLRARLWSSLVIVVGMTAVIAVLLSMLSLKAGLDAQLQAGDPGRILVLSSGPESVFQSKLTRDQAALIMDAPGFSKADDGTPLVEGEILNSPPASRKTGIPTFVTIHGFGPKGFALRPEVKMVSGRKVRPGAREIMVGQAARDQLAGLRIGDKVILPNGTWPIVGVFSAGGAALDGEAIADRDTLMNSVKSVDFNIVIGRLENAQALDKIKSALAANPALQVMAERETDYYAHINADDRALIGAVAWTTGAIMALGAMFGALNIMIGAVRARRQEIGTLRALGFGGLPVAVSVVSECLLLALTGTLIGSAIAWAMFNGAQEAWYDNLFILKVTPGLIGLGIALALAIALLGSLAPAIRAARLPIVEALRAA